jgi:hypothetical protein
MSEQNQCDDYVKNVHGHPIQFEFPCSVRVITQLTNKYGIDEDTAADEQDIYMKVHVQALVNVSNNNTPKYVFFDTIPIKYGDNLVYNNMNITKMAEATIKNAHPMDLFSGDYKKDILNNYSAYFKYKIIDIYGKKYVSLINDNKLFSQTYSHSKYNDHLSLDKFKKMYPKKFDMNHVEEIDI